MPLGQEISNTTISLQTTAKNSHFHQNVEKKQHKKNFEKFLKTTVTEDNFQVLDTDIITFFAALSLFSSLVFLLNGKSDFTGFNPEVVLTSSLMSKIKNMDGYYKLKAEQSKALDDSNEIAVLLFKNSRADYLEVLLNQRDALDAKMELVEAKKNQLNAVADIYKGLGGGWK